MNASASQLSALNSQLPPRPTGRSLEITTRNEVPVSVGYDEIFITWLPTEGKEAIIAKTAALHAQGHRPVPHISAFKVKDAADARAIAEAIRPVTQKIFVIRGGGQ